MKKLLVAAAAVTMLLGPVAARAQDNMGGLGFRTLDAGAGTSPAIGIRQWFSPNLGVDLGVGFSTFKFEAGPAPTADQEANGFAFDVGLPWSARKWDKVNFILRPGFQYGRAKSEDKLDPTPPNEDTVTSWAVSGELEVEFMFVDKVSVSASHGIVYRSTKITNNATPEFEQKFTGFDTEGSNFTQLGFHVYLW